MKAVVLDKITEAKDIVLSECPVPEVRPGIECVGEIEDSSDSGMTKGQKVIAMMGGMGRSFDGSYAEYALLPVHHVFAMFRFFNEKKLVPVVGAVYNFEYIRDAVQAQDSGTVNGKIVVKLAGS